MKNKKVSSVVLCVSVLLIVIAFWIKGKMDNVEEENYHIAQGTITEINEMEIIFERNNNSNDLYSVGISETQILDAEGKDMDLQKIQVGQFIVVKYRNTGFSPAISPKPIINVVEIIIE